MQSATRNIYHLKAYLQAQRVLYLLKVLEYIKALKTSYYQEACSITDDTLTQNAFTIMDVYGVDIPVETPLPVLIDNIDANGNGYSLNNLTIRYTINPADYKAFSAYVALLEEDEIINIIPSEKTGAGTAVFAQGFQFNLNKKYEVQIILNYGTGVEIRSEKAELKVVRMAVVNQLGQEIAIDEKVDGNVKKVEELRYSDGTNTTKRYRIKIELGRLFGKIQCKQIEATAAIMKKDGSSIKIPDGEYPKDTTKLIFDDSGILTGTCLSKVDDTLSTFALTNLSMEALGDAKNEILPLYGGIGNKFRIEFTLGLTGAKKDISIEPVGVIVIGIDGLRQDVLYPQELDKVNDGGRYRVGISSLIGLRQILAGYDQTDENKQRYKMLPEVTAVFPSITLASWASIFTGKFPGETGILGNEFFDRTSQNMITFSDGAFLMMSMLDRYPKNIASLYDTAGIGAADKALSSNVKTIYQSVKEINPELRSVVVLHNYSKGANKWLYTESLIDKLRLLFNYRIGDEAAVARLMDSSSADDSVAYINSLISEDTGQLLEKFPILFAVYLPGLDHWAHDFGMGAYTQFFNGDTDKAVEKVVKALKDTGEFNNKLFIITADHGMTEMPEFGLVTLPDGRVVEPDTSCKLNVKDFDDEDVQDSEKANNNLHIWEMGDYLKTVGEFVEQTTTQVVENKILAPREIANLFTDPATGQPLRNGAAEKEENANIIAALNGPMAHVYVKGSDWSAAPDANRVLEVAEMFRVTLQGARGGDSPLPIFPAGMAERLGYKIGVLSNSIDEILVRDGGVYTVYTVENASVSLKGINNLPSEYIDAVNRIEKMNNISRSGDIVLIMKDSTPGSAFVRYTTGVACKSWHGSLNPSDSYVPFIVAYPGGNRFEIDEILKKDTICKADYSECKGNWKLPDIVKEIISEQYK